LSTCWPSIRKARKHVKPDARGLARTDQLHFQPRWLGTTHNAGGQPPQALGLFDVCHTTALVPYPAWAAANSIYDLSSASFVCYCSCGSVHGIVLHACSLSPSLCCLIAFCIVRALSLRIDQTHDRYGGFESVEQDHIQAQTARSQDRPHLCTTLASGFRRADEAMLSGRQQ